MIAAISIDHVPDEPLLVERVLLGDQGACETLVRRHGGRMLSVARRLLRRDEDADDAVQDAFLSAFRSLGSFGGQSSLGTWLHRIVVNACLMRLRGRSRRRDVPLADLPPGSDEACGRDRPDEHAPAVLSRQETRAQVRACIDRLPEPHRTILLLRDVQELDTDETAERLGIRPGAVKTRLHRARQALRVLLEPIVLGGVG
jgi:RNA polymerase sigma-70 factor (ECF subfamily)